MIIDIHCHTSESLDSFLAPVDAIADARAIGLDAVCFTEHDRQWETFEIRSIAAEQRFTVVNGVEVSTELGHVLAFGLREFHLEYRKFERLANVAVEEGGALVLAHPFRRFYGMDLPKEPSETDIKLAMHRRGWDRIQAIEIWNAETRRMENVLAQAVAERLLLPTTGGSDAHHREEVGRCYTEVDGHVADEHDLVAAIREGRVRGKNRADVIAERAS